MKTEAPNLGRENFVSHLYQMLENPDFFDTVAWNDTEEGPSFVITDASRFQDYVLVHEFNHANFSSFVRQLNKYDFHKVKFRDSQSRVWEFIHPLFRPENRDKPQLIKRKQQQSTRRVKGSPTGPEAEIVAKAAETAAKDAEGIVKNELEFLSSRVARLESNNMHLFGVVKMQQTLIERLLEVTQLPVDPATGMPLGPGLARRPQTAGAATGRPMSGVNLNAGTNLSTLNMNPNHGRPMTAPLPPKIEGAYMPPASCDPSVRSVLLAVDNESARDVTTKFLQTMNYQVDAVDNGAEVVHKVESKVYEFIILEPILKSLDGLSAVEIIRQSNIMTPIILLLDHSSQDDIESYVQRGVSTILYRPFTRGELQQVLLQFPNQPS